MTLSWQGESRPSPEHACSGVIHMLSLPAPCPKCWEGCSCGFGQRAASQAGDRHLQDPHMPQGNLCWWVKWGQHTQETGKEGAGLMPAKPGHCWHSQLHPAVSSPGWAISLPSPTIKHFRKGVNNSGEESGAACRMCLGRTQC